MCMSGWSSTSTHSRATRTSTPRPSRQIQAAGLPHADRVPHTWYGVVTERESCACAEMCRGVAEMRAPACLANLTCIDVSVLVSGFRLNVRATSLSHCPSWPICADADDERRPLVLRGPSLSVPAFSPNVRLPAVGRPSLKAHVIGLFTKIWSSVGLPQAGAVVLSVRVVEPFPLSAPTSLYTLGPMCPK
jgi:hypothetical protein